MQTSIVGDPVTVTVTAPIVTPPPEVVVPPSSSPNPSSTPSPSPSPNPPVNPSSSQPPSTSSQPTKERFSGKVKAYAGIFIGFSCAGVLLNLASPVLFKAPSISSYSVVLNFQALMLTPLLGVHMHSEVKSFFEYMNFFLFNFSFLPDVVIFVDDDTTRPRHLADQRNEYLSIIGLESGSALYDMGKLIFVAFILLGVYFLVIALYLFATFVINKSKFHQ